MYFILKGDDCQFYLLPYTTYVLGRGEVDILIINDSINHKHALFLVTDDEVTILDFSSTYGTFVNQTKLKPSDRHKLNDGDTIKFGLKSVFRFQKVEIINTASELKFSRKWKLNNIMKSMGGLLLEYWSRQCNYVTVSKITFTTKVLSAVILGTPIVSMQYWNDYLQCLKSNEPLPDPVRYFPKYSKALKNQNISLEYKEERKTIFQNKVFLFTNTQDKETMEPVIKLAGGRAQLWDDVPLETVDMFAVKWKYILMHDNNLDDTIQRETLSKFLDFHFELVHRAIPCSEIALGIVHCTCEEYCNPFFLETKTIKQQPITIKERNTNAIINFSDSDSNDNENSSK